MSEYGPSLPITAYLNMQTADPNLGELVLPQLMQTPEYNHLLGATNNELGCMVLGLLSGHELRDTKDVKNDLIERGAEGLEINMGLNIIRTLDRLPVSLVIREGPHIGLSRMGMVAQSLAGHQLTDISPLAPLRSVYGNTYRLSAFMNVNHAFRVAMLVALGNSKRVQIPKPELIAHMAKIGAEQPEALTNTLVLALKAVRLIEVEKVPVSQERLRSSVLVSPRKVTKELGKQLVGLTQGLYDRDTRFLKDGRAKLQVVLDDPHAVAFATRRSLSSSNVPRTKTEEVAHVVETMIETAGRPLTSKQIYKMLPPEMKELHDKSNAFYRLLTNALSIPTSRLEVSKAGVIRTWSVRKTSFHAPRSKK